MRELMLHERHTVILKKLEVGGRVLANELADEFGVSEDTVRRDLREMASAGLLKRVYGGALPISPKPTSMKQRMNVQLDRKRILAQAAIGELEEKSTVFFDVGSTNLAIAEALPNDLDLTAVTNAPAIALALNEKPSVEVILIGGRYDKEIGACLGAKAVADVQTIVPDICLLGACGVDMQAGITGFGFEDAELKRLVASRSKRILVAATSEKLGAVAPYQVAGAKDCECLLVDSDADQELLLQFSAIGCRVVVAGDAG